MNNVTSTLHKLQVVLLSAHFLHVLRSVERIGSSIYCDYVHWGPNEFDSMRLYFPRGKPNESIYYDCIPVKPVRREVTEGTQWLARVTTASDTTPRKEGDQLDMSIDTVTPTLNSRRTFLNQIQPTEVSYKSARRIPSLVQCLGWRPSLINVHLIEYIARSFWSQRMLPSHRPIRSTRTSARVERNSSEFSGLLLFRPPRSLLSSLHADSELSWIRSAIGHVVGRTNRDVRIGTARI